LDGHAADEDAAAGGAAAVGRQKGQGQHGPDAVRLLDGAGIGQATAPDRHRQVAHVNGPPPENGPAEHEAAGQRPALAQRPPGRWAAVAREQAERVALDGEDEGVLGPTQPDGLAGDAGQDGLEGVHRQE
jgi:hypothetical protein